MPSHTHTISAQPEAKPKGKRGRPKGAKHKKTIENEAKLLQNDANTTPQEKRKPSRSEGSTTSRKTKQDDASKRAPGRPKGSKNLKTLIREAEL
ncbi:MAG: hypothetical protein KBS95_05870 [Alistipes sp.]|nr:hypothetical protein [Candidatus Alistipes equi]